MARRILSAVCARPIATMLLSSLGASLGGCGDASVAFCSGSVEFCADPPFDAAPIADAGPDRTVASGDVVTIDGSGSRANGSGIRSYSWTQTSGVAVALSGADTVRATFDAPDITRMTELTFRLTIVNDSGTADSDSLSVTVQPLAMAARMAAAALVVEHLRPSVLDTSSECLTDTGAPADPSTATITFTALWLEVRARAPTTDAVAVNEFLDEARRVVPWLHAALAARSADAAAPFVASATKQLARFSERRDPALRDEVAVIAARVATAAAEPPTHVARGTHTLSTAGDEIELRQRSVSADAAARSVRAALAACAAQPDVPLAVDRLHLLSLVSASLGASSLSE